MRMQLIAKNPAGAFRCRGRGPQGKRTLMCFGKRKRNPINWFGDGEFPRPVNAMLGAGGAWGLNAFAQQVSPGTWHPWANLGAGVVVSAIPARGGAMTAGFAGALFYAGFSSLYYRHIERTILQTMGATLAST